MASAPVTIDRRRIAELAEREEQRLEKETPKSYELFKRASKSLVNGVSSTYQMRDPYPVYFSHGKGSKIYSVDGREIRDFHNGFGCMVQGASFGRRCLDRASRAQRYLAEGSYPVYILHQTVIVVVAFYLVTVPTPGVVQWLLLLTCSVAGTFALYEIVRRFGVLRFLFGMKARRAALRPAPVRHAAVDLREEPQ